MVLWVGWIPLGLINSSSWGLKVLWYPKWRPFLLHWKFVAGIDVKKRLNTQPVDSDSRQAWGANPNPQNQFWFQRETWLLLLLLPRVENKLSKPLTKISNYFWMGSKKTSKLIVKYLQHIFGCILWKWQAGGLPVHTLGWFLAKSFYEVDQVPKRWGFASCVCLILKIWPTEWKSETGTYQPTHNITRMKLPNVKL